MQLRVFLITSASLSGIGWWSGCVHMIAAGTAGMIRTNGKLEMKGRGGLAGIADEGPKQRRERGGGGSKKISTEGPATWSCSSTSPAWFLNGFES